MSGPVFAWPVRPKGNFYVAVGYLDPGYRKTFGVPHTGEDWNLRTGGDSDLGYPVQAVFPGEVVAAGYYPIWGNLVLVRVDGWVRDLLARKLGEPLEALYVRYAHLHHVTVTKGERIEAGEHLGSIGKGDKGRYLAHLHLDFPRVNLPDPSAYPKTEDAVRAQYLDPARVWKALAFADRPNLLPQGLLHAPATRLVLPGGPLEAPHGVALRLQGDRLYVRGETPSDP